MAGDKIFQKRKAELTRQQNIRPLHRFLIVCEGEKTEPNYFKLFRKIPKCTLPLDIMGRVTIRFIWLMK
jgi:hypothetical protein